MFRRGGGSMTPLFPNPWPPKSAEGLQGLQENSREFQESPKERPPKWPQENPRKAPKDILPKLPTTTGRVPQAYLIFRRSAEW